MAVELDVDVLLLCNCISDKQFADNLSVWIFSFDNTDSLVAANDLVLFIDDDDVKITVFLEGLLQVILFLLLNLPRISEVEFMSSGAGEVKLLFSICFSSCFCIPELKKIRSVNNTERRGCYVT